MGYGDEILGTGMAKGLAAKGLRAAFGDGRHIIWSDQCEPIFRHNPNIAPPGDERNPSKLVWIRHYRGSRLYARGNGDRWIFNPDFRAIPGELYFSPEEIAAGQRYGRDFVVIEPNVKRTAPNKQWPFDRYYKVAKHLKKRGERVIQFLYGQQILDGVEHIPTVNFRQSLTILRNAKLFVGPEGGLHHAAAAMGVPAVVIFGGFIHPRTTGYEQHINLFSGGEACGTIGRLCAHCMAAMQAISVEEVDSEIAKLIGDRVA